MERDALRRVHRATGLFPLGAYLLFHAFEHWPVRQGRDALFARLEATRSPLLECVLVLVPLIVHAALGILRGARGDDGSAYASPAFRKLQLATGVLSLAFIGLHLAWAWVPRLLEPNPVGAAFMAMSDRAGTPAAVALHVVGLGAVCTHFGQGLGVALSGRASPRLARALGIAAGVLLWLAYVNELAAYASGSALL